MHTLNEHLWMWMTRLLELHGLDRMRALTDAVLLLACAWLLSGCYKVGRELRTLKSERDFLKTQLLTPPEATNVPPGINPNVLQQALNVCWSYSKSGIRNYRTGHMLIVGPFTQMLAKGFIEGLNPWQYAPASSILEEERRDDLKREMNMPGAHILDGNTGQIMASKFFAARASGSFKFRGSGTFAAKSLSSVPGAVVIKVSANGSVKEFRDGELFQQHCGSLLPQC